MRKHTYLSQWEKKRLSVLIFFLLHQAEVTLTVIRVVRTLTGVKDPSPSMKPKTKKSDSQDNVKGDAMVSAGHTCGRVARSSRVSPNHPQLLGF